jgi:ABC-type Fe3+-hydroxamate transport system substrate-binding protein
MNNTSTFRVAILVLGLTVSSEGLGEETVGYPRTINHEYGQTVIPGKPKRIVALEPAELTDSLIALGHPPLASATYGVGDAQAEGAWPPVIRDQALELGIRSIGTPSEPSLEAVAALDPDLIIAIPWQSATMYRQLSLIAPTIVVPSVRDFRPPLALIAETLDAGERADALLDELRQLQMEIKRAHNGTEIAIVRPRQFSTWLYGPKSNAGKLLTESGLRVVVPVKNASVTPDSPGAINDLSMERVPGVEADFLFFITYNLDEPLSSYLRHPIWQRNKAVKEGRRVGVESVAWTNHGPLGALKLLRDAKQALDDASAR